MPHVSNKKLEPELLEKLFKKLLTILGQAERKDSLSSTVNELLTDTEKTMLAKRLAIILMLESNTPQYKIAEVLKVSPTTVTKMSLGVEIGKYKVILKVSKKEKIDLEKLIHNILTAGGMMPPRVGGKYWKRLLE